MKKIYLYFQLVLFFSVILSAKEANADTCESKGSGNWNTPGTWTCDDVPEPGDDVIIKEDHIVIFNVTQLFDAHLTAINIYINGELNFQNIAILKLPSSSYIYIEDGASISFTNNSPFPATDYTESQRIIIGSPSSFNRVGSDGNIEGKKEITISTGIISLPVTLTSFSASLKNSFAFIEWSTVSEWDFSHYEVEKSFDGLEFDFLVEVDPQGGEDLVTDYTYTDLFPGQNLVYYRLKMVDLDGSFEYSKVVVVSTQASLEELSIFPNPAPAGRFSLYYPNAFGKEVRVSVMNIVGKEVFTKNLVLDRDVLEIMPNRELQSGHYTLNVQIDGQVFRKRMIFH
ncbi:T9SS type A sorting domain-containing protein [Flammeovirgaceae bacterium SG7u.111]|nr:T9SS type A sorting domain-containing protein [Flammeovirgaceae bacterium SG7u.132]WPO37739.1 T9SS type A sorting domain-containing protein [Flammeovirgaceae bacterium SG7u.111]